MDFEIGDVVRKKSGGPKMDVNARAEDNGHLMCCWIDKAGKPHEALFAPETLEKAVKRDAPRPMYANTGRATRHLR